MVPILTLNVHRGDSPWQGYTSTAQEEQRGRHLEARPSMDGVEVLPHLQRFVQDGVPWLGVDRTARAVVVHAARFGPLTRVDVTRLGNGETQLVGHVVDPALRARGRDVLLFLLESQVVQTFIHMEADLRVRSEQETGALYTADVDGVQRFYTNRKNEKPLGFSVVMEKADGAVRVTGRHFT